MKFAIAAITVSAAVITAQSARSVWDGVYTSEQAQRGEALYSRQCARCHGAQLTGGEAAPPLAGGDFLSNWNGLTVGDLFERIRVSMPQDSPAHLSRQAYIDVVAYILKANKFPAGSNDLVPDLPAIKAIKFTKK